MTLFQRLTHFIYVANIFWKTVHTWGQRNDLDITDYCILKKTKAGMLYSHGLLRVLLSASFCCMAFWEDLGPPRYTHGNLARLQYCARSPFYRVTATSVGQKLHTSRKMTFHRNACTVESYMEGSAVVSSFYVWLLSKRKERYYLIKSIQVWLNLCLLGL